MSKFKTILIMQLKEKLDLSFLKSKKSILFKVAFSLLGFAAILALAYLVFYLCKMLSIFSPFGNVPVSVMGVLLFVILVLELFTCTLGLSKTLYYSNDNQLLVTFPVNPNSLFISKMFVYYVNEVKKQFSFAIPIYFAYGMVSGLPFIYYIWMPVIFIILTAVPVLLGGLLSIPMNYFLRVLNRWPILKILLLSILLCLGIAGIVILINKIPSNINLIRIWAEVSMSIRSFLASFTKIFFPFYAIALCLCGVTDGFQINFFTAYSWIVPLSLIASIGILLGLNLITSRPLYLKLITKEFEFNKRNKVSLKKNIAHKPFASACLYEMKRNLRNTGTLSVSIATLIIAPIAILFLNKIYAAINTRLLGNYLTISFNVLIILLFVLAHNINVGSIFSRDGEALYINKTKPNKVYQILLPRLIYNSLVSVLILTISCGVFFSFKTLSVIDSVLCLLALIFLSFTHIVWSAELDFLKPQANIFKTEGIAGMNKNEIASIILCFAMSFIGFGLTLFLLMDGMNLVWVKLFIVSIMIFALRFYLFNKKAKILFKDIQ